MNRHVDLSDESPLATTGLTVTIVDLLAEYELRHTFRNEGKRAIEAVYSFPVPLDAAFIGMTATIAGEALAAQVISAPRAAGRYDDAIADGDSAVLLERLEPGMLCVNLGNLKPGEEGEIVLRFAAALAAADRTARFSLPLVHRPRYGRSRLDERVRPENDFAVEHSITAEIRVRGMLADRPVQCASERARFEHHDHETLVRLDQAALDRDLVLRFDLGDAPLAAGHLVADGDQVLGIVQFSVPDDRDVADALPLDLCLVLDGSGSMSGDSIAQSRECVRAIAWALHDDDRVQVLRFGSSVVPLFRRPLRVSARVRDALAQLASVVDSDLGGTEMAGALGEALHALTKLGGEARHRVIVLVTDGAVNWHEIEAAQKEAARQGVRIFIVAVGSSAGVDVLAPLAERTGGCLERAVPAEPIDAGVLRQLRRARHAGPVHVDVEWNDSLTNLPVGVVYPGDAATAVAVLPQAANREMRVVLPGVVQPLAILAAESAIAPALRAWVGQQIYLAAAESEREAIAVRYGLITGETSAVLVKVRDGADKADSLPEIVRVKHMVPEGMVAADSVAYRTNNPAPASDMGLQALRPAVLNEPGDAYLDIPAFLRRQPDSEMESRNVWKRRREQLPDARVTAIRTALVAALYQLLLVDAVAELDDALLLARLALSLRADAQQYVREQCGDELDIHAAAQLLETLMEKDGGLGLTDDDEARLAVLSRAVA